jgi:hypothetical protein
MTTARSTLSGSQQNPSTPVPGVSIAEVLLAPTACAAAGAQAFAGKVVNVAEARYITLLCDYDAAAAGGRPSIVPLIAATGTEPSATDDSWFVPGVWDGAITGGTLGAIPSGADWTAAPDFGLALFRQLAIVLEPADGSTNELRVAVPINVTWATWFTLAYAEHGVTGSPGTLGVQYVLSV